MGFLDAATQVVTSRRSVMMIAYDLPYPKPLAAVRPLGPAFGLALLLSPSDGNACLASVGIELKSGYFPATTMADPTLEALRQTVPAARALPLLAGIAANQPRDIIIESLSGTYLQLSLGSP
jgi:hypothetical protein